MRLFRAVFACLAVVASMLAAPAHAADSRSQTVFLVRSSLPGCEPTCPEWIYITGKITRQTLKEFEAILKDKVWEKPPIVFNSKGGGVDSAMAIGRLIRKHRLISIPGRVGFAYCDPLTEACRPSERGRYYLGDIADAGSSCEASCVIAFAGGVRRLKTRADFIMPPFADQAYERRRDKPDSKYLAELSAYFDEMGLAPQAFDYLTKPTTSPGYRLWPDTMKSTRLTTETEPAAKLVNAAACKSASPPVYCVTRAAEKPSKSGGKTQEIAEKKKEKPAKKKAEPEKKESYQLPMKVVVVRSSEAGCEPNCPEWIQAEGEITANSPGEFRKVFKQIGKRKLPIIIRSPGGSVNAAVEIGRMIRKRGLDVAVGFTIFKDCAPHDKACKLPKEQKGIYRGTAMDFYAFCTSACPLILASGTERIASDQTYVGLHQIRTTWVQQRIQYREEYKIVKGKKKVIKRKEIGRKTVKSYEKHGLDKRLRKQLTAYLGEMGVGVGMLEDMERAPPSDMYKLPGARVTELKLTTTSSSLNSLTAARICGHVPPAGNCSLGENAKTAKPMAAAAIPVEPDKVPGKKKSDVPPADLSKPMTFALVRPGGLDCKSMCPHWIAAQGRITSDTPQQLKKLLDQLGMQRLPVLLHSNGGDLAAAMELGRLIREHKLDSGISETILWPCGETGQACIKVKAGATSQPGKLKNSGTCSSACVMALSGGQQRYSTVNPTVRIEQPLFRDGESDVSSTQQAFQFLASMGIRENFARVVIGASAPQLRSLSPLEISSTYLADRGDAVQLLDPKRCLPIAASNCVDVQDSKATSSN